MTCAFLSLDYNSFVCVFISHMLHTMHEINILKLEKNNIDNMYIDNNHNEC